MVLSTSASLILHDRPLDLHLTQFADCHLRVDLEGGDVFEFIRRRIARLDFDARIARDTEILFLYRFAEAVLHGVAEHFLAHLAAKLLLDDLHGHLAGPEAVQLHGAGEAFQAGFDFGVDLVKRQRNGQAAFEGAQGFQVGLHQIPFFRLVRGRQDRAIPSGSGAKGETRTLTPLGART